MILPFDAHNHVHLGPSPPRMALIGSSEAEGPNKMASAVLSGIAIMSTHPRDFQPVMNLSKDLPLEIEGNVQIIPCLGVHPWFLHEVSADDWKEVSGKNECGSVPKWVHDFGPWNRSYNHEFKKIALMPDLMLYITNEK